jgi:hypothetical protein
MLDCAPVVELSFCIPGDCCCEKVVESNGDFEPANGDADDPPKDDDFAPKGLGVTLEKGEVP